MEDKASRCIEDLGGRCPVDANSGAIGFAEEAAAAAMMAPPRPFEDERRDDDAEPELICPLLCTDRCDPKSNGRLMELGMPTAPPPPTTPTPIPPTPPLIERG